MPSRVSWNITDYDQEGATVQLTGPTLNGTNYDAQVAEVDGIRGALEAIILGRMETETIVSRAQTFANPAVSSKFAERELKLLFTYVDDVTGERGTFTVPTPDLDSLDRTPGSDKITLQDAAGANLMAPLVLAIENWALSKAGNSITIESARVVGRNL
jgi:hypothetical protein